jgi:hypothetical protein
MLGGLSPIEVWTGCRSDHSELCHAHVFGCPVYVLDPKLADGEKIPKWNHRARMGMFLGFSHEHSSLVPPVLNLRTGHVSPQYLIIFDNNFETVPSLSLNCSDIDDKFAALFDTTACDSYLDQKIDDDNSFSLSLLDTSWNDDSDAPEGDSDAPEGDSKAPEGVSANSEGATAGFNCNNPPPLQRQSRSTRNQSPAYAAAAILATTALPLTAALHTQADLPAGVMNKPSRNPSYQPTGCLVYRDLAEASVLKSPWANVVASAFTAGYSGKALLAQFAHNGSKLPGPQMLCVQSMLELEPDLSPIDTDDLTPASINPLVYSVK